MTGRNGNGSRYSPNLQNLYQDVNPLEREVRLTSIAHDAIMVDHLDQKLHQNREDLKRYREQGMDAVFDKTWDSEEDSESGEDDGMPGGRNLVLGNQTVNHITKKGNGMPDWLKTGLLGAGLIGGPLLGGLAGWTLSQGGGNHEHQQSDFTDTDTRGFLEVDR